MCIVVVAIAVTHSVECRIIVSQTLEDYCSWLLALVKAVNPRTCTVDRNFSLIREYCWQHCGFFAAWAGTSAFLLQLFARLCVYCCVSILSCLLSRVNILKRKSLKEVLFVLTRFVFLSLYHFLYTVNSESCSKRRNNGQGQPKSLGVQGGR